MRNEICIMDHSFVGDLRPEPISKLLVTYPRLSEGHQAINGSEEVLDIRQCQNSKGASQAMSSDVNLGITIESLQCLDLRQDISLNNSIASHEAIVDHAISASWICHLIKGQINDPILEVAASSKSQDNGIEIRRVSGEALDVSDGIAKNFRILKDILPTSFAVPSIDIVCTGIGNIRIVGQLKRH